MKYNKLALFYSSVFSFISLVCYTCFEYVCCIYNPWISNISLALFGSSALIVATSIIGYLVEKSNSRNEIIHCTCELGFGIDILSELGGNNELSRKATSKIVEVACNKATDLRNALKTYYDGCILKDSSLKTLINDDLYKYYFDLSKLISYTSYPNAKNDVISFHFEELLKRSGLISDKIVLWMKSKKFTLGEDFDFGDDFIQKYENEINGSK